MTHAIVYFRAAYQRASGDFIAMIATLGLSLYLERLNDFLSPQQLSPVTRQQ
jgi:predicted phage tail protein